MKTHDLKGSVLADSVYLGSVLLGNNATFERPEIMPAEAEVNAVSGRVNLPNFNDIDPMECTVTLQGIHRDVLAALTPEPHDLIVNIVQHSADAAGTTRAEHIKIYMRAIPRGVPALSATYGEIVDFAQTFDVHSYRQTVDGTTYTHIDPVNGIVIVNGKNYADSVTSLL